MSEKKRNLGKAKEMTGIVEEEHSNSTDLENRRTRG